MPLQSFGKGLAGVAFILLLLGLLLMVAGHIPFLGRLPGDILIRRGRSAFYFPVATCIVISLALTLLFNFLGRK